MWWCAIQRVQSRIAQLKVMGALCRLRRDHGIDCGVSVLLSTEKPRCKIVASEEVAAAADPREYQVSRGVRQKPCCMYVSMRPWGCAVGHDRDG